MLKKLFVDVFFNKNSFRVTSDFHSEQLGEYYLLFPEEFHKMNRLLAKFDENGIPLCKSYIDVEDDSLHYYPITIGQVGLAIYQSYWHSKLEEKRNHFMQIANWFYENRIEDKRLGCYWLSHVPKPEYNVNKPWKSAFAQSRAISILLRAWQLTGKEKYLETAKKALKPFHFDISEGGVTAHAKDGKPMYEEYVAEHPTMVLDGAFFSMMGLYDFVRAVSPNIDAEAHNEARKLLKDGVEALINWLPEYDMGFWLRYNHCEIIGYPQNDPCTINYLCLVKVQLQVFYEITGRKELMEFKRKLDGYDNIMNITRMYVEKYKALKKLNRI